MKKIKQVFPSRNYITVDSYGDVEVIFNPVGDGFEGDDKLMFRKGRWAFRVNDFLSGKVMADGSKEGMGRKVYSLNLVYDDEDGEPVVNTTYVDPTSVIPLDGSMVDVVGSEKLAQKDLQNEILSALTSVIYNKIEAVENSVDSVGSTIDNMFDDDSGYVMRSQIKEVLNNQAETLSNVLAINSNSEAIAREQKIASDALSFQRVSIANMFYNFREKYKERLRASTTFTESIGGNRRYSSGTVFYFGTNRFISLRSDCITISVGSEFLLLGDMSEYNNGTVKRLDGVKFAQSDVTKIVS